jgi:hypothetical protein
MTDAGISAALSDIPCQRWRRGGRPSWARPEDGGFNKARYGVKEIDERPARDFVMRIHYAGTWVATLRRYGLFDLKDESGPRLVGAAILSNPSNEKVLTKPWPAFAPYTETADVGRFCLEDQVPANAESHFLREVCRLAAADGYRGLVLFSDPVERWAAPELDAGGNVIVPGRIIKPGHFGIAYQGAGAIHVGESTPGVEYHFPDGSVFNRRAAQKIRARERGHMYAEQQLIKWGAPELRAGEDPRKWLTTSIETLVEAGTAVRVDSPGKLEYVIPLGTTKRARQIARREMVLPAKKYPKPYLGQLELFSPRPGPPYQAWSARLDGSPERFTILPAVLRQRRQVAAGLEFSSPAAARPAGSPGRRAASGRTAPRAAQARPGRLR